MECVNANAHSTIDGQMAVPPEDVKSAGVSRFQKGDSSQNVLHVRLFFHTLWHASPVTFRSAPQQRLEDLKNAANVTDNQSRTVYGGKNPGVLALT